MYRHSKEKINSENVELALSKCRLGRKEIKKLRDIFLDIWDMVRYSYRDSGSHGDTHIYYVLTRSLEITTNLLEKGVIDNKDRLSAYRIAGLGSLTHDLYSISNRKTHHVLASNFINYLKHFKIASDSDFINKKYSYLKHVADEVFELLPVHNKLNYCAITYLDWLKHYTLKELELSSTSVREHRASYDGEFGSIYSEILSAADRDTLDLNIIINRIYSCSKEVGCVFNYDEKWEFLSIEINSKTHYFGPTMLNYLRDNMKWSEYLIKTYYHLWEKFSRVGYMFTNINKDGLYFEMYKEEIEDYWKTVDVVIENPYKMLDYIKEI